ncbi:hypothetical protein GobsT_44610 [Gemmata obscuriglobus]|uniref:Nuclear transport factor 2 family protein n=1 Tax=Gemmata obscuriglobus TaxID=114 RepID=A0A2Z3GZS0_9BACT|nr:hypothetical protein [Gemmata obscuriglobus]AWM37552.1 hypothetical protein C1280_11375 [Gemmata obscuriglobus]QEG29663.1 hypothetical protein GobsT_44610 [Gemmata obscuriglobus]VTS08980.1 unnamed protein product [Gemmata obscuriglobus UQM 2246]
MSPLPEAATDAELVALVDRWVGLLEQGDYEAANELIPPDEGRWAPNRVRWAIEGSGGRATVAGESRGLPQRRVVDRWEAADGSDAVGEIWYDLNIDGVASDLTATFWLVRVQGGQVVRLKDIHVM